MKIEVKEIETVTIILDGKSFKLTKAETLELIEKLKTAVKDNSPVYVPVYVQPTPVQLYNPWTVWCQTTNALGNAVCNAGNPLANIQTTGLIAVS